MISLLVPFRDDDETRGRGWEWLRRYWRHALPEAELVEGAASDRPFWKARSINRLAAKATGDVFVIIDADCYMAADVLRDCAKRVKAEETWFVPYRGLVRMTRAASDEVLRSDPAHPPALTREVGHSRIYRQVCGIVNVLPRVAFDAVGGYDERFRGWGGEDEAFIMSVDALYAQHVRTPNDVFHLWHRPNQRRSSANRRLLTQYREAFA